MGISVPVSEVQSGKNFKMSRPVRPSALKARENIRTSSMSSDESSGSEDSVSHSSEASSYSEDDAGEESM